MKASEFYGQYQFLWPELANASLLVDLYRAQGAGEPEKLAAKGYVSEEKLSHAVDLLKSINEPSFVFIEVGNSSFSAFT
ncbi:hypothetical protein ACI2KR_09340 [Pseudomonas luteola]